MIDVDDPSTWPDRVRAWVEPFAEALRGTTEYTTDLAVPLDLENEFRALLADETVRADHYTRLLDHEVEGIKREGLRPLTEQLVIDRITGACAHGVLDTPTRDFLLSRHVFATGGSSNRADRVCFVLGRGELSWSAAGCDDQLSVWGGEGIYNGAIGVEERVRGLGQPAMVTALIDLSAGWEVIYTAPSLPRLFVGTLLQTRPRHGEAHIIGGIPPEHVLGVHRPGDPEYDRHAGLPRG
jgi:hypothetical protein